MIGSENAVLMAVVPKRGPGDKRQLRLRQMVGGEPPHVGILHRICHAQQRGVSAEGGLGTVHHRPVVSAIIAAAIHPPPVMDTFQISEHLVHGDGLPVADRVGRGERSGIAPDPFQPLPVTSGGGDPVEHFEVAPHTVPAVAEYADISGSAAGDREGVEIFAAAIRLDE